MAYSEDTFSIICSFLKPVELVKTRYISHHHNIWVKNFLLRHYGTVHINKYLCPMCGDLYDTYNDNLLARKNIYGHIKTEPESLEEYTNFDYGYPCTDHQTFARYQIIDDLFYYKIYKTYERVKILCDNCSIEDFEFDSIESNRPYLIRVNNSQRFRKTFRYRGDRNYTIYIVPCHFISWAILFSEEENISYWNELRVSIPSIPPPITSYY